VLHRPLSLRLLAPTVLVSLVLVAACSLVALYLNHLNRSVSTVLSENVRSTQVALGLETTTKELVRLLRSDPHADEFLDRVAQQNEEVRALLAEADELANLESEKVLVNEIRNGLTEYLRRWDRRKDTAGNLRTYDGDLADHLEKHVREPCIKLRDYNASQIETSDRANRSTVAKLQWGLIAVGLGGPLGGLLLGYAIARSLRHSIYQLSVRMRDAAGRLNRELGQVTLNEESDLPALHRQMQGVIEEIERVVEQLQQREREVLRAEQLAAVGQVAAGVAHEIRNPLTSVKMLVQTGLEGETPTGLPPEDLKIIENEVRRMEQFIRLFLDFAKPPRSERRPSDLKYVIRRAIALIEGRARRQQVVLTAELPDEPVVRNIDPEQIHQVLLNLLLNALDALPRGGDVKVTLDSKQLGPLADGAADGGPKAVAAATAAVAVRVQDSGPGIAPHIHARLFEPFISNKETGLGLGLSICKRLVEGHGGAIQGANAREGGAAFTFTLPE
jgi:signal transduction histidine kinase